MILPTPRKIDRPFADDLFRPGIITQPFAHEWPNVEPAAWNYHDGTYGFHSAPGATESSPHLGVDYALPCGTDLRAPADGVVRIAGWDNTGFGLATWLDLGGGLWCLLAHQSALHVEVGQHVTRDQIVGESGTTGLSSGCHLHFATCFPDGMGYFLFCDPAPYVNYQAPVPAPVPPVPVPPPAHVPSAPPHKAPPIQQQGAPTTAPGPLPTASRYKVRVTMYLRTAPSLTAGHGVLVRAGDLVMANGGWSTNWRKVLTRDGHEGWAFASNLTASEKGPTTP